MRRRIAFSCRGCRRLKCPEFLRGRWLCVRPLSVVVSPSQTFRAWVCTLQRCTFMLSIIVKRQCCRDACRDATVGTARRAGTTSAWGWFISGTRCSCTATVAELCALLQMDTLTMSLVIHSFPCFPCCRCCATLQRAVAAVLIAFCGLSAARFLTASLCLSVVRVSR